MSEPVGESPNSAGDGRSVWTWLLPALTFLVGAALSAALFALGDTDDAELTPPARPRRPSRPRATSRRISRSSSSRCPPPASRPPSSHRRSPPR